MLCAYHEYGKNSMALSCRPSGFYGPYTVDRNNYIDIHPTQAQVAKITYLHLSKYLNQNVSPQLQYLLFRIMCLFSEKWVYSFAREISLAHMLV
jgi:hypothetical protein